MAAPGDSSPRRSKRRSLLAFDPSLSEAVPAEQLAIARRGLHVEVLELPAGSHGFPEAAAAEGCVGYLLGRGILIRTVSVMGSRSTEPLGPGDVLRPWQEDVVSFADSEMVALTPVSLARLDHSLIARAVHFPNLVEALMDRAMQRSRFLAVSAAIDGIVGVDRRLIALMWTLAERWGEVRHGDVHVPIELKHQELAGLVAARRPSVTTALAQLQDEGRLERVPGGWILRGDPPPRDD